MSRRVLVTGGGTGIGAAIARGFAEAGDAVTVSGRRREPLEATAAGHDMTIAQADITDEAGVAALFAQPFDVVVANAGVGAPAKLVDTTLEQWNWIIGTNLTGVFLTFREALRGMAPGGRLIAIASTSSLQGGSNIAPYSASKHGVLGLVRSTAKEVAKKGITCNAVCPGFVDTEMAAEAAKGVAKKFDVSVDKAMGMIVSGNPMARLIAPDEVASAALYLASPGASSVNGHALSVSGGEI
ncbi:3-oxoacyl-[acyl-carrier protein] reductase [Candidatus Rhodobacter oscarellae]|uniref:3-oxoacyl-[acyl-carrier protein] reductase n=1 Tax=Candidatus Rhodobacter oscarellae TaxID=1675527 RepID=A0A0J9E6G4_9RHOB|nr:SDR family oxidoreductase [Candidatus Rhodobacter lobularis]KMW58261.1 3-oxoacyl-[acyl-carrier protein] reductase [Candidatus Rhodobacter lobularis]